MRLYSNIIGKQIVSTNNGRRLGTACDLYFDAEMQTVVAIFLSYDDLFAGNEILIERKHVFVFGRDAILTAESDVVDVAGESSPIPEMAHWVRGNQLVGQEIQSAHERPLGTVTDLILSDPDLALIGFVVQAYGPPEQRMLKDSRTEVVLSNVQNSATRRICKPFPLVLLETI